MNQPEQYAEMRDIWTDYNGRQEFEHELINRKTTWLLTTQGLLFAAYGVTFGNNASVDGLDTFRNVVAGSGLLIAAMIFIGVLALINSKRMSWQAYQKFFSLPGSPVLPKPFEGRRLDWGVDTRNTPLTLVPDVVLPIVFVWMWGFLLLNGTQ